MVRVDTATPTPTPLVPATNTPTDPSVTPNPTAPPDVPCTADCDGDHVVSVAELVAGTDIALGRFLVDACEAFDVNRDGTVGVHELVAGVGRAVAGCPELTPN